MNIGHEEIIELYFNQYDVEKTYQELIEILGYPASKESLKKYPLLTKLRGLLRDSIDKKT